MNKSAALAKIAAKGFVSAEDVTTLRRNVFHDGVVSPKELDALFKLAEHAPKGSPEWPMFFEEAAADFYLREEEPYGYITDAEFETLKARITRDGHIASPLEIRLLLKLLETSTSTPTSMHDFVGEQLRHAILSKGADARVTRDYTELMRRFIFTGGGDGHHAVTRAEAELLFDINDATMGIDNDPAWTELFVKAIANHLMAHFSYAPPSREEALARHDFMSDHSVNVGGFFKRMISGGLAGFKEDETSPQRARNEARERGIREAEKITPEEAEWLADRIGRDGVFGESERRLIQHMRDIGAELPPKLKALIERAA